MLSILRILLTVLMSSSLFGMQSQQLSAEIVARTGKYTLITPQHFSAYPIAQVAQQAALSAVSEYGPGLIISTIGSSLQEPFLLFAAGQGIAISYLIFDPQPLYALPQMEQCKSMVTSSIIST